MSPLGLDEVIQTSKINPKLDILDDRAKELAEYWNIPVEEVWEIYRDFNERKTRKTERFDPTDFETIRASYGGPNKLLQNKSRMMLHHHRFKKAHPVVAYLAPIQSDLGRPPVMLDYGCGVGDYALAFAVHGYKTVLCDLAGGMIDLAAWRFRRRGIAFETIELAGERVYPDGVQVDVIVAGDVLEHLLNPPEAIARLHALLFEGGYLWVPDYPFKPKSVGGGHLQVAADLRLQACQVAEELFEVVSEAPPFMLRRRGHAKGAGDSRA